MTSEKKPQMVTRLEAYFACGSMLDRSDDGSPNATMELFRIDMEMREDTSRCQVSTDPALLQTFSTLWGSAENRVVSDAFTVCLGFVALELIILRRLTDSSFAEEVLSAIRFGLPSELGKLWLTTLAP